MVIYENINRKFKGQAATELAVFGAVLVFLIGGIVRNGLSASQQQNIQLKTMRKALLESYLGSLPSSSLQNPQVLPHIGRTTSTILYFEDRLSPDMSRYGSNDRVQVASQASGTLSNLMYYSLDQTERNDEANFPKLDVYINGLHVPLTTARVVTKNLTAPAGYQPSYTATAAGIEPVMPNLPNGLSRFKGWEFKCKKTIDPNTHIQTWHGCPLFYKVATKLNDFGVLTPNEAYDLNRNDNFNDDPKDVVTNGRLSRKDISWHWSAENAIGIKMNPKESTNNVFDVDNDGQEETIYAHTTNWLGIESVVTVMDGQEGDLDTSVEIINARAPGLQNDMYILTEGKEGTFLEIKEGRIWNPRDEKYMKSQDMKISVELVERLFQLTRDTGRFCSNGVPAAQLPDGTPNPVETCGNTLQTGGSSCFDASKRKLTCFDVDNKMLYLRARILDKTGHAWLADKTRALP